MNRKTKILISLSAVLLAVALGVAVPITLDRSEKNEWSIKQAEIDDQCIYSQWSDKFGFKFYFDSSYQCFTIRVDKSFKHSGTEYIDTEEGLEKYYCIKAEDIASLSDKPKTEFVKLDIPYDEILNKYIVGDFGTFKSASRDIENIPKKYEFFLWQDKYLVCIYKNFDKSIGRASICDTDTGKAYIYEKGIEACYPKNINVESSLIEPVYYIYNDTLICVYKFYNKIYVTRLD